MQHNSLAAGSALATRLAPPLVGGLAALALARELVDAGSAAEILFLALVSTAVLLCAGALAPRPAIEPALGAVAVLIAFWTIPGGHGEIARGAATLGIAGAAFASALARRLLGDVGTLRISTAVSTTVSTAMTAAIGLQIIARGERLLAIDDLPRTLVSLVGLPIVVALALSWLAHRHGVGRALLVGATTLVLGPGWNVASTLALLALAAIDYAGFSIVSVSSKRPGTVDKPTHSLSSRRSVPLISLIPVVVLVVAALWDLRLGSIVIASAAVFLLLVGAPGRGTTRDRRLLAAAALVATLVLASLFSSTVEPANAVAVLFLGLMVVPWTALPDRDRWPLACAAIGLAVAAAFTTEQPTALAAPLALAALALPKHGARMAAQGAWSGVLVALTLPLAAYPWLRPDALQDGLAVLGLTPSLASAALVVALAAVITALAAARSRSAGSALDAAKSRTDPPGPARSIPATFSHPIGTSIGTPISISIGIVVTLALAALIFTRSQPTRSLTESMAILDRTSPSLSMALDSARPIETLAIETSLANAAELPAGTAVATVEMIGSDERERWSLEIGTDTGEWAARRADLVAAGVPAPEPSRVWVSRPQSESETGLQLSSFFSSRYRSVHQLSTPIEAHRLVVRLRPDLPEQVALTLFSLEVSP